MKKIYMLLGTLLILTASCSDELEQFPPNIANSDALEEFGGVLNAAYYYQLTAVTPMAIMGEFRADNAFMFEPPYTEFDAFTGGLTAMEDEFFRPVYGTLYKSILSSNNVIDNSDNAKEIGEAKFLRALSYFKLVQVFGAVPVNLDPNPSLDDPSILARVAASEVYNTVIIPDLNDAIAALDNATILEDQRASNLAAQALLGKVYMHMGDYGMAETYLKSVIDAASGAGIKLIDSYDEIFGAAYEVKNTEIIFSHQISSSIIDEYGSYSGFRFWNWYVGDNSKSDFPIDQDLVAAFDASDADAIEVDGVDLRRAVTLHPDGTTGIKFPKEGDLGPEHNWIEIRLADIILLYAEALNENGTAASTVLPLLDDIRMRAGLKSLTGTVSSQADVRQAIADERRLELALEGHRWFDLVRTGTAQAEMGEQFSDDYYLFPIPISEILATKGVITQNSGY